MAIGSLSAETCEHGKALDSENLDHEPKQSGPTVVWDQVMGRHTLGS